MFGPTLKKKTSQGQWLQSSVQEKIKCENDFRGKPSTISAHGDLNSPSGCVFLLFFLDKAENDGMLNLFRTWSSMSSFVRVCRSVWEPLWLGEPSQCIWPELHSPQEGQDVPAAGMGSSAGRHPHHPGNRCHHLTGPVFLPSTRGRQWRWVH